MMREEEGGKENWGSRSHWDSEMCLGTVIDKSRPVLSRIKGTFVPRALNGFVKKWKCDKEGKVLSKER